MIARAAERALCSTAGLASRSAAVSCGLEFDSFNVGDGPAAFLIFIVGTVVVVAALVVDGAFSPPWWVHLVWIPVTAALTIGGLRVSKAWLLAQEYRHRARGGGITE